MGTNIHNYILPGAIIFLNSCMGDNAYGPMGNQGYGWSRMMHYGFGGIFMWIIFVVLMGALMYAVFNLQRRGGTGNESPLDILKKRYARGEVTKEEFDGMRKDLQD
jgi:putative membrane protein